MKKTEKRYIIRKYILASSAEEALRREKRQKAGECWVDENWMRETVVRGFSDNKLNRDHA